MPHVMAAPVLVEMAATDLAAIESAIDSARAAVGPPTLALLPAAGDEVSAGIAQLFAQHADDYQKAAGQAAAFHGRFMQQLTATASLYTNAESANAALLAPEPASRAAAATGIPSLDAIGTALNHYIDAALDRIILVLLWPFLIPAFLYYLPFYVTLARFFPGVFPTTDLWKIFFFPFL